MRALKIILPALLSAVLACSCNEERSIEALSSRDAIRLEVEGKVILEYNPVTYQLGFNSSQKEFRVNTDSMSDYFIATLSEIPVLNNQVVNGNLEWTTATDVVYRKNIAFRTVRLESDKIWLWNSSGRIGLEVRVLE